MCTKCFCGENKGTHLGLKSEMNSALLYLLLKMFYRTAIKKYILLIYESIYFEGMIVYTFEYKSIYYPK